MPVLPLHLGIARPNPGSPQPLSGKSRVALPQVLTPEIKKAVLDRDGNACQCCGFQSARYQEVHFIDQNRQNLRMDNLATVCVFCHQCFNLDLAATMRSGVLIWLPEISQVDLHHIARAVYVARISQGAMAESARVALDAFMGRREEVRRRIFTDDPFVLATVMRDFLTARHYADRVSRLEGIRLFPLDRRLIREADLEFNQFPQILAYWRSKEGPFGNFAPSQWTSLYKKTLRQAA
ncbi:MAG: HNH endonuclease [Alphaproteobacteria bacterium]|nr:HNH endonuclease [Alphaproteobacteria bacterium]